MRFHPFADVFPLIEGAEFERVVRDIAEHGLLNPITLYQGMILDGRNRYRACRAADVKPRYVEFEGDDAAAVAFVVSQNLARRHLGPSERAMVAARMATLKDGQRKVGKFAYVPTQEQAAKLAGVSERSVKSARVVLARGTADLQEAVMRGRLAVHEAAMVATEPAAVQHEFLAAGKTFIHWRHDHNRKNHAADLAASALALPVGEKRWPVVLADPPWDYDTLIPLRSRNHPADLYATMTDAEICALPVGSILADPGILFLWATQPRLELAFEVIRAWGLQYKSGFVWDKELSGLGYWVRGQHEHLLVAIRGNMPTPPTASLFPSVIRERRREHSRKPERAYEIIERMYPDLPKIELFARRKRPGWARWGNQAPPEGGALDAISDMEKSK